MTHVSVCISTWNRADDLRKCLQSVYNQTHKDIDVFVVDNCSNDDTMNVLHSFKSCNWDMKYHVMPHSRFSAMYTINMALRQGIGPYVLILDDDAIMNDVNTITKLVKTMDDHTNCAIASVVISNNGFIDWSYIKNKKHYSFGGACALFRKSFCGPNYYNETFKLYFNENEISLRILENGYDLIILEDVIVEHYSFVHRSSLKMHYYMMRNTIHIMNKVLNKRERILIFPIFFMVYIRSLFKYYNEHKFLTYLISSIYIFGIALFGLVNPYNHPTSLSGLRNFYLDNYIKDISNFIRN